MSTPDGADLSSAGALGAVPPDPLVGSLVAGKYKVLRLVARGGMGKIFLAEQQPLQRKVALKVLSLRSTDNDAEFRSRFFLEAATLGRLKHPNTVTVFDYGSLNNDDAFYMVMEFVEGRTLSQVIKDEGNLDVIRALRITYEISRSLVEAHEQGIIHRDLKPGNVMIGQGSEGEVVKVLDFGIAKVLQQEEADHVTRADQLVGSPRYMSPEQIKGETVDFRSDQYSLGVMLFEMLTGQAPFKGNNTVEVLLGHLHKPVPAIAELRKTAVPDSVDRFVRRCLEKEPAQRFGSIKEVRDMALNLIGETSNGATLPPGLSITDSGVRRLPPHSLVRPEGMTESDLSQSTMGNTQRPAEVQKESGESRRSTGMLIGLGAVVFVLLGVIVGLATRPDPAPVEEAAQAPVRLTIRSTPADVEVVENSVVLGRTPLTLPLERFGSERTFILRAEGFEEARLVQGPAESDLTIQATLTALAAEPAEPPTTAPKQAAPPKPQDAPKTGPTKAPPKDDMGIRSQR
ncbi:protein kinase [Myxococcota bacterium]|jgi:serine/threonine protein kinase|nr:protein kinase [Myxococcota bacterium]